MKILIAQKNPVLGDIQGNIVQIANVFENARGKADLIVFPELMLSGYSPEDMALSPAFLADLHVGIEAICTLSQGHEAGLLISTPYKVGDFVYNALLLIANGEIRATMPKHRLPFYGVFDETRIFKAGGVPEPVEFKGERIGFMTCEDMWFGDVSGTAAARGATMLVVANASPYELGKADMRIEMARMRVGETGLPLLYVNMVGGQDDIVFDGCSFGMNADGSVAFGLNAFEEDEAYCQLNVGTWEADKDAHWPRDAASVYGALKLGLRDYVLKNGFKGVLLGLSGGVDSALVATLAVDALGAEHVHSVMMPSPYTAQMSIDDAEQLAVNLGISHEVIPIKGGMDVMDDMLGVRAKAGLTPENIQSRLRGVVLMGLSNATGGLVLACGNKSELAVGYSTLYGDMCGGYAPIKDVYKTDVYALCDWLNRDLERIPNRILTRAPSAELKDGQTDQDSLPPYDVLDDILDGLIEQNLSVADLQARGHDGDVAQKVASLLFLAEYKRRQGAPGPKVTAKAFGRERRYPITNRYRLHAKT